MICTLYMFVRYERVKVLYDYQYNSVWYNEISNAMQILGYSTMSHFVNEGKITIYYECKAY